MDLNYISIFKNNIVLYFTMVFFSTFFIASCSGGVEDVKVEDPFFEIVGKPSVLSVSSNESTTNYQIRSNRAWKIVAKESGDWIKSSPSEGQGNGTFRITVQENKTFEKRVMNFAFFFDGKEQSEKLRVEQEATGAFLMVTDGKDGLSVISEGGEVLIGVQGNVEWKYTLDVNTWLTESKKSNSELELKAKANLGWEVRKATATITSTALPDFSAKVIITQASGAFLNLPATNDGLSVISDGGEILIGVETNMKWKYNLDDNSWLLESSKSDSQLELTAKANVEAERKATVTITSTSLPDFSAKVVITQLTGIIISVILEEDFNWLNYGDVIPYVTTGEKRFDSWTQDEKNKGWEVTPNPGSSGQQLVYARPGFVKLGKTGFGSDLISPKLTKIKGTQKIKVTFKAAGYISPTGIFDDIILKVSAIGGGTASISEFEINNRPNNKPQDEAGRVNNIWDNKRAYSFIITGATSATQIRFLGGDFDLTDVGTGKNRIFLDDIKVELVQPGGSTPGMGHEEY